MTYVVQAFNPNGRTLITSSRKDFDISKALKKSMSAREFMKLRGVKWEP